ncbi:MAG TPA: hypothetical protein ENK85_01935 [Saprospiraceae bacterium]|nr:hypothetical protein [Saprospiraceae bacterium]
MRWLILIILIGLGSCMKPPSPTHSRQAIHLLLNNWHKAAATADEEVFFGSLTDDAIYLGTDPTERWTKSEFEEWSKTFFDRDTAWAFTPRDRVIYFSPDGKTAWFEELLDTWMGVCRGSGVLLLTKRGWKISHYHLALTIENDKMKDVIRVTQEK